MKQTTSQRTTEKATRVDPTALSHDVVTRLVHDIVALRKVLQDLRCCTQWRDDCPFHGAARVDQAFRHLQELKDLRLRLAIVLSMQRSIGTTR